MTSWSKNVYLISNFLVKSSQWLLRFSGKMSRALVPLGLALQALNVYHFWAQRAALWFGTLLPDVSHRGRQESFQVSLSPPFCPHFPAWVIPAVQLPCQGLPSYIRYLFPYLPVSASRPCWKLWFCFVLVWDRVCRCCSGCPEMPGLKLSSCLSLQSSWGHKCVHFSQITVKSLKEVWCLSLS